MPDINQLKVGERLPERSHTATNASLFFYNAVIWNAHRIHYDENYATQVEHHPGIVIDGPLQGDWLTQAVLNWLGDAGAMTRFQYSNRRASYLGDTLISGGAITGIDLAKKEVELELFIKNTSGEVTTPGTATVRFG